MIQTVSESPKVLKNALFFIMGYFVAMEAYVTLLLLMYVFAMYIL